MCSCFWRCAREGGKGDYREERREGRTAGARAERDRRDGSMEDRDDFFFFSREYRKPFCCLDTFLFLKFPAEMVERLPVLDRHLEGVAPLIALRVVFVEHTCVKLVRTQYAQYGLCRIVLVGA